MACKPRPAAILGFVVAAAFFGSLLLALQGPAYLSPDESANAFFAGRFAEEGQLWSYDPLNHALGDALVPRSMLSLEGRLLPGSFLGLPVLYGAVGALAGTGVLPFLTPLVAAAAVFAWYGILRRLFGGKIALVAAVFTAVHPAWWYYASRGLMHNVLFVSLLVFSGYVIAARPVRTLLERFGWRAISGVDAALSGILLGLALFVRTSEAPWVALVLAGAGAANRRRIRPVQAAAFLAGAAIALMPMLVLNADLYGGAFSIGYVAPAAVETVNALPSPDAAVAPLFPFGIHPRNMARHFHWYGLTQFWWMSLLALIGLPAFLARKERERVVFVALFAVAGVWLVTLYGSWVIHDNPDPTAITIGNSYVRYWLPLYLASTPLAAAGALWAAGRARTATARALALAALLLFVAGLGIHTTFFRSEDSLVPASRTLAESKDIRTRVLALTESDAVIVVDRADKLFFPYRRVRQPLRDEATYALMPRIAAEVPLYYYGVTFPPQDIAYLNGEKLAVLGLRIELVETFGFESLYRIRP